MTDREKILRGAECCKGEPSANGCPKECPYLPKRHLTCGLDPFLDDVIALLKEQEENDSEWLEDSDPGQEYGTTWACRACGRSLHMPFIWNPYEVNWKFCPWCGKGMKRQ